MSKQAEIAYFENMTEEARRFVRDKPFSAAERGAYLFDMGQILSLIPAPPAKLLDLGCGSGWTTAMFALSGYDALGTDIAPAAIRLARETFAYTGARYEALDYEQLPFEAVFDVAVLYDCLHHADNERAVIRGVFRALKPGGETIIVEPGRGHRCGATSKWAVKTHGVTEKDMPPRLTAALLREAGFGPIRVFPRARFQVFERKATGGIARLLSPIFGSGPAALAKTVKNSIFTSRNGVVLAGKPGGAGR